MRNLFRKACKSDRDGVTAIYAAIAASLIVVASPASRPALAQVAATAPADTASLAGDWSGALDVQGVQLHLVLHVMSAGGKVSAALDSLDQGAMAIPVSTISRAGDRMTFTLDVIAGGYDGVLSADAKSVSGTWSQGGAELPLALTRK